MEYPLSQKVLCVWVPQCGIALHCHLFTLVALGLFIIDVVYFSFSETFTSALSKAFHNVLLNTRSPSFFTNIFVFAFMVSATQFMLQVSDKFGPGILWKFITGKYYHPRQEERIFMFLDLRASTTVAERKLMLVIDFEIIVEKFSPCTRASVVILNHRDTERRAQSPAVLASIGYSQATRLNC